MTDDLPGRVEKLTAEVDSLKKRGKDRWDKFQLLATLLIPAVIGLVGFKVSESLKEAEIASAQRVAAGNEAVARVNARVSQATLVKGFLDALLSDEPRKRKLAIESVLIALPEDGPRLVRIVAETDPDEGVRQFSTAIQRRSRPVEGIDGLSDRTALELIQNPPVRDTQIETLVEQMDPTRRRDSDPAIARTLLKRMVVLGVRDDSALKAWEAALAHRP